VDVNLPHPTQVGEFFAPHCDQAVLHAPSTCQHCDAYPAWQHYRQVAGIAFTGQEPVDREVPCPSDARRGRGGAHAWGGNRPTEVDPGPPGPGVRAGFGPRGDEPQRSFPVRSRWSWLPWR
jgi:hypothetical protein